MRTDISSEHTTEETSQDLSFNLDIAELSGQNETSAWPLLLSEPLDPRCQVAHLDTELLGEEGQYP